MVESSSPCKVNWHQVQLPKSFDVDLANKWLSNVAIRPDWVWAYSAEPESFVIDHLNFFIKDHNVATLFKLTFGGN